MSEFYRKYGEMWNENNWSGYFNVCEKTFRSTAFWGTSQKIVSETNRR